MVVVVFRSRINPGNAEAFSPLAEKMHALAREMPGFISYKVYLAEDGERVSIHEWETVEHLHAWRDLPQHAEAQKLGRERFYAEYTSYVCDTPRESRFSAE